MKKVMVFGTFDIIHEGHLYYFKEAKRLGDYLIVVVARDRNSFEIKGKKPRHNETDRLAAIKKLPFVNEAVLGDREMRSWEIIKQHSPTVIALGYDQWQTEFSLSGALMKIGLHPMIVRIKGFRPETFKTSKLLNKK